MIIDDKSIFPQLFPCSYKSSKIRAYIPDIFPIFPLFPLFPLFLKPAELSGQEVYYTSGGSLSYV